MLSYLIDLFNVPDLLHFAQAGWWEDFWGGPTWRFGGMLGIRLPL